MPPKQSSPVKMRALNTFFSPKDESTTPKEPISAPKPPQPATVAVDTAAPASTASTASPPSPEKKKPRKRTTKPVNKESSEDQQTTSANSKAPAAADASQKAPPKSKAKRSEAKRESVPENTKPVMAPLEPSSTTEPDNSNNATTAITPSPLPEENKETKSKSPSKSTATNGAVVSSGTANSPGSNLSKINKIDTASMFKVRSGKAYITETKLKFSTHPSAILDLCKFHEYREKLQEADDLSQFPGTVLEADHVEIASIPSEHYSLIAKLVEESELLLGEMASSFMPTICPLGFEGFGELAASLESQDGDEKMEVDGDIKIDSEGSNKQTPASRGSTTISSIAIMEAVQAIAQRVNYGVPVSALPFAMSATPPNLSVYRWEVQDIDQYFPSDMKAAVVRRRNKRMEASAALTAWFLGLDAKQKEELCPAPVVTLDISMEGGSTVAGKKSRLSMGGTSMDVDREAALLHSAAADTNGIGKPGAILLEGQPTVAAALDPAVLESKLKDAEAKKKEAEAKEERRLERERKLAERQLEKDMKEAERLQKEEARRKKAEEDRLKKEQTSMRFVGFFKPIAPPSAKNDSQQICTNDSAAPPLSELFHPFHVKMFTTLAPVNRFSKGISQDAIDEALNIQPNTHASTDGVSDMDLDLDQDVPPVITMATTKATLSTLFSKTLQRSNTASRQRRIKLPRGSRFMTVSETMESGLLLQEESDDLSCPVTWRDIPSLRMRLFQFVENYRPAYYGTWSKRSKSVTGRRFLGKDSELIDYDFDSEAEWEEDEEGEELKSDDDEEDAEDVASEPDEEDDWLVPEGYLSDDEGLDAGEEGGSKSEMTSKKSKELRRPALAQMTPIIVGPMFEMRLGETTHPALEPYHIEFLGDFGVGMDMYHAVETTAGVAAMPSDAQV
ncbi:Chromatin assembly factor 1, subunit A [Dissophora globulifera]|uniref:Chromatin assembly factor 1, subunit A n=1 Tax=Dissophora globulifera TaxID=979702 RepID=A0A9P6RSK4_9FUNG|nr:Chromatin assembly factor 1, subunit A [Dissophora globulifera]